jgi:hypothetical protein
MENKTAISVVSSTTGLTLGQIPKHRSVLISPVTSAATGLTLSFMDNTGSPSNQFNMHIDPDANGPVMLPLRITGLTATGSVSVAFLS